MYKGQYREYATLRALRAPLHFHLSFSSHWYTFYLLIYWLVYSTIYFSTSLVTVRTKTTIENKMSETTERLTHSLYCLGVATIWVFFYHFIEPKFISPQESIFSWSASAIWLYLLWLLCSSQKATTQSNHRFIKNCHIWNWRGVWTVSTWFFNWMFHFGLFGKKPDDFLLEALGYIQVCFSSTKVWKCYVYFVDCWTTIRSITFHRTYFRILK